jgi:hypothetical protein
VAAIAAGLALLLFVPPVRAWVLTATGFLDLFGEESAVQVPAVEPERGTSTVSITPSSSVLRIVVSGRPSSILLVEADASAVGARLSVAHPTGVTALPDGFRLDGADGATIAITLPNTIQRLELTVDGQAIWTGVVSRPLGDGWSVPLVPR